MEKFQERINYHGDLSILLNGICAACNLAELTDYKIISIGYEDFNLRITTNKQTYFIKILANHRDAPDIQRYESILEVVSEADLATPEVFKTDKHAIQKISIKGETLHFCVMDFIEGEMLYNSSYELNHKDVGFIAHQVSKMHKLNFRPDHIYDHWDSKNFEKEYSKNRKHLTTDECGLLDKVKDVFHQVPFTELPYAFIHGDLIETNILRSADGQLYIIDFAVSSYSPRIQELAVLMCNTLFSVDENAYDDNYQTLLQAYQSEAPLTQLELECLPRYITIAHGMHFMCATMEKRLEGNDSAENEYWLNLGLTGLKKDFQAHLKDEKI